MRILGGLYRRGRAAGRLGVRLRRNTAGSTAIEFAMVIGPFLGLLFAILEVALVYFGQVSLDVATAEASRKILTGQAQAQNMSAAQFQQAVCNNAAALFTCSGLYVNVQKFGTFSSIAMLNPLSGGNFNAGSMKFSMGVPGDIMLVQVFYQWPVILAPLSFDMSNMNGNKRLLVGTAVFRNEPY